MNMKTSHKVKSSFSLRVWAVTSLTWLAQCVILYVQQLGCNVLLVLCRGFCGGYVHLVCQDWLPMHNRLLFTCN